MIKDGDIVDNTSKRCLSDTNAKDQLSGWILSL